MHQYFYEFNRCVNSVYTAKKYKLNNSASIRYMRIVFEKFEKMIKRSIRNFTKIFINEIQIRITTEKYDIQVLKQLKKIYQF